MAMMMFALNLTAEAKRLDRPTKLYANEAKHRIAVVDQQKALIEEMSNTTCMAATGLKVEAHIQKIKAQKAMFEKVHNGLQVGDPEIGLTGEEHYSRVLKALAKVDGEWRTYLNALAQMIEEGDLSDANATIIFDDKVVLLAALEDLLTAVKIAYSNPADLLLANAFLIELITRQQALVEAVAKDVCLVNLGWQVDKHKERMRRGTGQLETTTHC